jgi:hypothetical protein
MQPDRKGLGSADLAVPQTLNRYAYVNNDPVNFYDPDGLDDEPIIRIFTWARYPWSGSGGGWFEGAGAPNTNPNPDPLPKGPRGWGDDQDTKQMREAIKVLAAAKNKAKARIKGDCGALFAGLKSVDNYLSDNLQIGEIRPDGKPFESERQNAATGNFKSGSYEAVITVFNLNGSFITGKQTTNDGKTLDLDKVLKDLSPAEKEALGLSKINSLDDFRQLVVLHELYHAAVGPSSYDFGDPDKSKATDNLIQKYCF